MTMLCWLDTRRKANRVGLPDCDTVLFPTSVSLCKALSNGRQKGKTSSWIIAGITLSPENKKLK